MIHAREPVIVRFDAERLRFDPRSDGRWRRFEETWTGCHWRTRGSDLVDYLEIDLGDHSLAR